MFGRSRAKKVTSSVDLPRAKLAEFVALADQYADLGPLYHPTAKLREMAKNGQSFFG